MNYIRDRMNSNKLQPHTVEMCNKLFLSYKAARQRNGKCKETNEVDDRKNPKVDSFL